MKLSKASATFGFFMLFQPDPPKWVELSQTLLDTAVTLHLHKGNLMNWGWLKKCAVSTSEELGN
ncbi:unnamed protein product [Ranitomeya imitator]|uniref:Uncharacterized protein n=1 Tax=Ranitomeya imitator TaxID=111125 RepID=A0ABN9LMF9_9NEOB|nr:unnamed protein product [Ranitomeya imitator]